MIQLGQCVQRLATTLADNYDEKIHFKFAKLDIKYGFCRLAVSDIYSCNFCCVFPQANKVKNIDDIKRVVPNCLQMVWCESPPFFCAASETSRYVIDTLLHEVKLT